MTATPQLPDGYAILLRFDKRLKDLELLVDRLIQNEMALMQGIVACEARLKALEEGTPQPSQPSVVN